MAQRFGLTTTAIGGLFEEEILSAGGTIREVFDDGTRLIARAVLSRSFQPRPLDKMQPGVAIHATEDNIFVHPYVYRLICKNGASMARAVQTRRIEAVGTRPSHDAEQEVREAVRECCTEEAFESAERQVRSATEREADMALAMLPLLSSMRGQRGTEMVRLVMAAFTAEGDRSAFGLMSAVTAVARDERDPDTRWRLEELGGSVCALLTWQPERIPGLANELERYGELVGSGGRIRGVG